MDQLLLERIRSGDVEALGSIYDRYGSLCLRFALRCAPEPATAEDVVFSVFMRLWNRPPSDEPGLADWLICRTGHGISGTRHPADS